MTAARGVEEGDPVTQPGPAQAAVDQAVVGEQRLPGVHPDQVAGEERHHDRRDQGVLVAAAVQGDGVGDRVGDQHRDGHGRERVDQGAQEQLEVDLVPERAVVGGAGGEHREAVVGGASEREQDDDHHAGDEERHHPRGRQREQRTPRARSAARTVGLASRCAWRQPLSSPSLRSTSPRGAGSRRCRGAGRRSRSPGRRSRRCRPARPWRGRRRPAARPSRGTGSRGSSCS